MRHAFARAPRRPLATRRTRRTGAGGRARVRRGIGLEHTLTRQHGARARLLDTSRGRLAADPTRCARAPSRTATTMLYAMTMGRKTKASVRPWRARWPWMHP
eukprot:11226005-Heterocapsa_arctica.AAC.1